MLKTLKNVGFGFTLLCLLVWLLPVGLVQAKSSVKMPIVKAVNKYEAYSGDKPLIHGFTADNTNVLIYVDGSYVGHAQVEPGVQDKPNRFRFYLEKELKPGKHKVMAIAQNRTSLVLSAPSDNFMFVVPEPDQVPKPTLVWPQTNDITTQNQPVITGLTVSGTRVHVFVDGVYYGKTDFLEDKSGTADFSFQVPEKLKRQSHQLRLVSEDRAGRKSKNAYESEFVIEPPMPAPTVVSSEVQGQTISLAGVAKNDTQVRLYVDHEQVATKEPADHPSGVTDFAFTAKGLTKGKHVVYTVAVDSRGKESRWSEPVHFQTKQSRQPRISDQAVVAGTDNIDEQKQEEKADKNAGSGQTPAQQAGSQDQAQDQAEQGQQSAGQDGQAADQAQADDSGELDQDLVGTSTQKQDTREDSGLINEDRENQGKLGWNLIIFLVFLAAVIAWIFWVNRELIKERRQSQTGDSGPDSDSHN